jgi:hypothetical protein
MAAVASTVGAEDTRPHERSHPVSGSAARRWVTFAFGVQAGQETAPSDEDDPPWDLYRLEAVRAVQGATSLDLSSVTPGCLVGRRENESVRPPTAGATSLQGAVELKHSSGDEEASGLTTAWERSPWRVALVILFSHAPSYWNLPLEGRSQTYLGWSGAQFGKRPTVMGRVLRRLYKASSLPASQWDYLAYLEMQPEDVAHVREHLTELRDVKRNPAHSHVVREIELWLTKQVDGSSPFRPSSPRNPIAII